MSEAALPDVDLSKVRGVFALDDGDEIPVRPAGWRILVEEPVPAETSKSGLIHLASVSKDAAAHMNYVGRVVAMGEHCFKHRKFQMFDLETQEDRPGSPWCKVGDWIVFGRYAGQKIRFNDKSYRFVDDDNVLAVTADPEAFLIYV